MQMKNLSLKGPGTERVKLMFHRNNYKFLEHDFYDLFRFDWFLFRAGPIITMSLPLTKRALQLINYNKTVIKELNILIMLRFSILLPN